MIGLAALINQYQYMKKKILGMLLCAFSCSITAQDLPTPSKVQLEWQRLETIGFVHFSVNTYTDMEWGYGNESPAIFNPTKLDCRQWARTFKAAGLKGIILTAKHHDGFCLWPSPYTEYSVKNSPWKDGKGDLVREFTDACREYGLKVGLYLSPWDCNHPDYGKPEYITYFKKQLHELLTSYGELFEFWFDGANGGRGYYGTDSLHTRSISKDYYPWEELTEMVYELQPNCVVHGGALANIRWVGNEQGYALEEHWSTFGETDPNVRIQQQLMTGHADGHTWKPSETDVSVRPGWYYHASEDHKLFSLPKLLDIYYNSVGRNSLLLLNIPPNKDGLIQYDDSVRLMKWKETYTKELSNNLITRKMRATSANGKKIAKSIDANPNTYWQAAELTPSIEIDFKKELLFNRIMLREYIQEGQRVKAFNVEYFQDGEWKKIDEQTTIGYKRILRTPEIKATKLRLNITDALAAPQIADIQLFYAETQLELPLIKRRQDGMVFLQTPNKNVQLYYTTDGTTPSAQNGICYKAPFAINDGTCVKVAAIDGNSKSEVAKRDFVYSKSKWGILPEKAGKAIFDEHSYTSWISPKGHKELVIDLGEVKSISGFSYLPDQARYARGIVDKYKVEISHDNINWQVVNELGEFGNIHNNPIVQDVRFDASQAGRYFRFTALSTTDNQNQFGVAEFDVLVDK